MFKASLFENRRQKLAEQLENPAILVLFSGKAPHRSRDAIHHYHANRNFFYLTGVDRENAALVLTKKGNQVTTTLFIEHVDPQEEKWTGKRMSDVEAQDRSGISSINDIGALQNAVARLLQDGEYDHVYVDLERASWDQSSSVSDLFAADIRAKYPAVQLHNAYRDICKMRSVKSPEEVDAIREAIRITKDGIENMMRHARPGMRENQVEAHFDFVLKTEGVKEHAFPSIIAGGERATVLHYEENDALLEDGNLLLCDLGAAYNHYSADITRTFPVNGKFTDRQKQLYEIVLTAMDETIAAIRPGMTTGQLNDVTKATLARELKKIGLIQEDAELSNYYYHGVSHPLGLDTHDVGARDWPIEVGAVITIEPGLYVAEEGIGIRIEDDVLVTENGSENLSKDIIKRVEDIEAVMAEGRS